MSLRRLTTLALACLSCIVALLLVACDRPDPAAEAERERLEALAQRLDLPEVPALEALQIASRYSDGSYSVSGVQRLRDDLMDQEVEVIAIVREHYQCERDQADDETDETNLDDVTEDAADARGRTGCLRPHVYVSDSLRASSRLLVVGFTSEQDATLEEGQRYRFSGRLTRRAPGHLSPEEGLLDLRTLEPLPEGFSP